MDFKEQVSLREMSWFKTGGVTEYFTECETLAALMEAVKEAKKRRIPYLIIGDTSNLLMSDSGYPGVIIRNKSHNMVFLHDRSQVMVEAGMPLAALITRSITLGYGGLEFLVGIPGTVGGAVYNNTAAFGLAFGDYVRQATLLFPEELAHGDGIRRVNRQWFDFDYGISRLKQLEPKNQQKPIILSVTLQLSKTSSATSLSRVSQYRKLRQLVDPPEETLALRVYDNLFLHGKRLQSDGLLERNGNVPPAYFVHLRQVRAWRQGRIHIYQNNPNFIVNDGLGTSRDAASVIAQIEASAQSEEAHITPTIEFVGLWE